MNRFSTSSAGIGDALLRSASALAEGNNTLDESIGLVVAANATVQDTNKVGKCFAQKYSNILVENGYIG